MNNHWLLDYKFEDASSRWLKTAFMIALSVLFLRLLVNSFPREFSTLLASLPEEWRILCATLPFQLAMLSPLVALGMHVGANASGIAARAGLQNWRLRFIPVAFGIELLLFPVLIVVSLFARNLLLKSGLPIDEPVLMLYLKNCPASCFLIIAVSAIFLAPLAEEFFFRRIIFESLTPRLGVLGSMTASSLIFSMIHGSLLAMPGLFILALALQVLYIRYRSLYPAILLHSLHNLITLLLLMLSKFVSIPAN
ncbi:MAG: hypothetical protein A2X49_04605 [Lentisphaerae bacterium GWF2_52_8]|nr:MAG: hypothetical protein A2X49_04605 [Lentisphaerae bacterium GWF2_52_8]